VEAHWELFHLEVHWELSHLSLAVSARAIARGSWPVVCVALISTSNEKDIIPNQTLDGVVDQNAK